MINDKDCIIQKLIERIELLEVENAKLKLRLGLDSNNISKPPSSDGESKKSFKVFLAKLT